MIDSPLLALVVLAALAAVPLALRRLRAASPDGLRVLGRTALHKGAVVAVVAVGDRKLVLGAGERGVQVLTELDPDEALEAAETLDASAFPSTLGRTDAAETHVPSGPGSTAALEALLGPPGSTTATTTTGPGIGLVDRLRAMTVRSAPPPRNRSGEGTGSPFRVPLRR